jgi:hypothetical protein
MSKNHSVLAALLLVASTTVFAGENYVALDLGQGKAANACTGIPTGYSCTDTATTTRIGIGHQFSPNIAAEIGYLSSGDATASGTYYLGKITAKQNVSGINLAIVGSVPVNEIFSLIGKVGILNSTVKTTVANTYYGTTTSTSTSYDNSTVGYGFGTLFKANDTLSLRIMYEDFGSVKSSSAGTGGNITMFSAGLLIGF